MRSPEPGIPAPLGIVTIATTHHLTDGIQRVVAFISDRIQGIMAF
jgi:hypothetical protein